MNSKVHQTKDGKNHFMICLMQTMKITIYGKYIMMEEKEELCRRIYLMEEEKLILVLAQFKKY